MPINTDFDPGKLLYYNPDLVVQSNLTDAALAYQWALVNNTSSYLSNDAMISRFFDSKIFISDFKSNLDVSRLNQSIYQSMLLEGFSADMLESRAKIAPNIYHTATLVGTNRFQFDFLASSSNLFRITPLNLQVGDVIQLQHSITKVTDYSTVVEVVNAQTFKIDDARTYTDLGQNYIIMGIKVYDLERIARINCLRFANVPPYVPPRVQSVMDPEFNPDLYRLLYPEAKNMGDLACYQDYIQRRDNDEYRIRNADDLGFGTKVNNFSGDSNSFAYQDRDHTTVHSSLVVARHLAVNGELSAKSLRLDEMTVTNIFEDINNLNVDFRFSMGDTSSFIWRDVYVRGLTQDAVRTSDVCNPAEDSLITEWAIKSYVDRPFHEVAVFNGDLVASGNTVISGPLQILNSNTTVSNMAVSNIVIGETRTNMLNVDGNAVLAGATTFQNTVQFSNEVHFDEHVVIDTQLTACNVVGQSVMASNVLVNSNLYAPNIHAQNVTCGDSLFSLCNTYLENVIGMRGNVTIDPFDVDDDLEVNVPAFFNDTVDFAEDVEFHSTATFHEPVSFSNSVGFFGRCNIFHNMHASNVNIDEALTVHVNANYKRDILYEGSIIGTSVCIGPPIGIYVSGAPSNETHYDATVNNLTVKGHVEIGPVQNGIALEVHGLIHADNLPVVSDRRVKKNIEMIDGITALEAVNQINSYYYHYLNDRDDSRKHLGFMADEVEQWLEGAVIATSNYAYPVTCGIVTLAQDNRFQILTAHPVLSVGDMVYLDDAKPYRITGVISAHVFDVERPIPVNSRTILRVVIQQLKTIDYTYMLGASYAAIHHLTNGGGINHIVDGTVTFSKMSSNVIGSNQIIASNVTFEKMAADSVGTIHMINGSVDNSKIAMHAISTDQLQPACITVDKYALTSIVGSNHIIDKTVTLSKMADLSISSNQIVPGCIGTIHLSPESITTHEILNGSITLEKMAQLSIGSNQILNSNVTSSKLVDNAVQTSHILDRSVTYFKLSDDAVGYDRVIDKSIVFGKLADGAVGSNEIIDGEIVQGKLGIAAVTTCNLLDQSVTFEKMADDSIGTHQIRNRTISGVKLELGAVGSNELMDMSVNSQKLNLLSVQTEHLADSCVVFGKIATNAVGSSEVMNRSLSNQHIAYSSIGSNELMDGCIIHRNMANRSIGSNELILNSVLNEHMTPLSIGTGELRNGCVTIDKLDDRSVGSNQIRLSGVVIENMAGGSVGTLQLVNACITSEKCSNVLALSNVGCTTQLVKREAVFGKGSDTLPPSSLNGFTNSIASDVDLANNGVWVVSCSSGFDTPWQAFDRNNTTNISCIAYTAPGNTSSLGTTTVYNGVTSVVGEWIQLTLPFERFIQAVTLTPVSLITSPRSFVVLGSLDSITWNLLHIQQNADLFITKTFSLDSPALCTHVRVVFVDVFASTALMIQELTFQTSEDACNIQVNGLLNVQGNMLLNGYPPLIGLIQTEQIQDGAVTLAKMATGSVGSNQLLDGSISGSKMTLNSIGSNQIMNNSVDVSKLTANAVGNLQLVDESVTSLKLADNAVTGSKIVDNAISTSKIENASITSSKLSPGAVNTIHLVDDSVTSSKIARNNIMTGHILDGAVTLSKIRDNAVGSTQIMDGSILPRHLDAALALAAGVSNVTTTWAKGSGSNIYFNNTSNISDGCVGIGTMSPIEKLHVNGNIFASGSITWPSDARIKCKLKRIEHALDKITSLNGYTFYRTDIEDGSRKTGLIAQDVMNVLPEAVYQGEDEESIMRVSYGEMMGLVVEALKELKDMINSCPCRCQPHPQ